MKAEKQVNFRMPDDLKTKVKESAERNRRTLTAEIIVLLEGALENEKSGTPA
ncbi:Arc family DNA-binding protein [Agrobacterium pusense]|uniref:Arc family DNA-binding protein n=1 Tax=Agrobacterium pusense TaxID=648995 RepID=UPI0010AE0BB6|nr:Arc family DNA-binding protein [Agrobacterium pusense]WCK26657.1 Arc family DNA-binding protein [Agrobacterium pusense]